MRTNQAGIDIIKSCEGCRLEAYPDPGSGGDPWTIGYGHTGKDVHPGLEITQEEAESLLLSDISRIESSVSRLLSVPISDNQFSALVSFTFNVGPENLKVSHLLKKVNIRDFVGAADEFIRWNKASGKVLPGLTGRREKEAALFRA